MKKSTLLLLFISFVFIRANAQDNMGIGTISPDPSAVLELEAIDKGLLIPRLSTPQKLAVVNPAQGLLVYDFMTNSFWYFNGTIWVEALGPVGPIGPAGPAGQIGSNGATGATGLQGIAGVAGSTGAVGSTGNDGAQGATGPTGNDGLVGAQVLQVTQELSVQQV